jgi:TIR domain
MIERALFISHASEDAATVERIVDYLERNGLTCWIAGRDIPPKAVYAEAITEGVKNANACGVIVSRAANASAAIKRELELASSYSRPFIPIRIDDVEPGARARLLPKQRSVDGIQA